MLIALASLKGSPGVTTFAVALAAQWPSSARRLVVECDPAGGDLALRLGLPASPGLVSLAAAARRTSDPDVVWHHSVPLPDGTGVITAPPGGLQARAALQALVTCPQGLLLHYIAAQPGVVVLADCGRLDAGSPAEAVAHQADVLMVVTGTGGDDVAHLAARLADLGRWTARPALLLAGQGYPTPEIERELGVGAIGRIPHDPAGVAVLTGRTPPSRRHTGGGLARCAAATAHALTTPIPDRASAVAMAPPQTVASAGFPDIPGVPAQQMRHASVRIAPPPQPALPTGPAVNGHRPASTAERDL
jgi:hypothetical protein